MKNNDRENQRTHSTVVVAYKYDDYYYLQPNYNSYT